MKIQLGVDSLKLLVRASIGNSYFIIESGKHPYFRLYLQLLYKNQYPPLPGLFFDFMGWLTRSLPSNNNRRSQFFDIRYQNQLVNILLNSKAFDEAIDLGRTFREKDHEAFLTLCTQLIFEKIAPPIPSLISPGLMREICNEPLDTESALAYVESNDDLMLLLDPEPWINEFRKNQPILLEEDLRALRMVRWIHSDSQRIGLQQCWKAQAWIEQNLKLKIRKKILETRDVETPETMLAGTFPMGGIAGISNKGTLNTILPSELLYSTIKDPVDLFQVKFVENDLLYYLRDQQQKDEFERKLKIKIKSRDQFPDPFGKTNFSMHPFFLFGIIVSWIKFLPKFIPAIHFFIDIEMETPTKRSEDFFHILTVLTQSFQSKGKVRVIRAQDNEGNEQTYHVELLLGTNQGTKFQMDWNGVILQVSFHESTYQFNSDSRGHLDWIEVGLYVLAGVDPPIKLLSHHSEVSA